MDNKDLILFYNGIILNVDENNIKYDSMCVQGEHILSVGNKREIKSEIEAILNNAQKNGMESIKIQEIDLKGQCIVPGFIDAHMHPVIAIYFKTQLKLTEVKSYSKLKKLIKLEEEKKKEGDWIICFDLLEDNFEDPKEHFFPDRYLLDEMCANKPLFIMRHDGHKCCVNSEALKQMNLDKNSIKNIEIESGEIQVDKKGNLTGVFTEGAVAFALNNISIPSTDRFKDACIEFSNDLLSNGITTIGAIIHLTDKYGIAGKMGKLELPFIKYFIDQGDIESDLVCYLVSDNPKKIYQIKKKFIKLYGRTNKCAIAGIKLWSDGSFGASTAYMKEPFTDSNDGNRGMMVMDEEVLFNILRDCYKLGLDLACHAIGDNANKIIVKIYEDIINNYNPDERMSIDKNSIRCRVEHASLLDDGILKKMANLNIIVATQPIFIESEYEWIEKRIGHERIKYLYPFKDIINHGVILAGASDAPIERLDVLNSIRLCVTRNNLVPDQSITPFEALKMFTINAAYSLGQENIKGSIKKGKLADFVILNYDLTTIPFESLNKLKIIATYHRGREVYSSR